MRISAIIFGVACTSVLLFGCASSPSSMQSSRVGSVAQPATGAHHPVGIDLTYKNQHPPRYPMSAIAAHQQGVVVLDVFVNAQSEVSQVKVYKSSGYPALDAAAVTAAEGWKFIAGMKNGKPSAGVVRVPVTFSMQPCDAAGC